MNLGHPLGPLDRSQTALLVALAAGGVALGAIALATHKGPAPAPPPPAPAPPPPVDVPPIVVVPPPAVTPSPAPPGTVVWTGNFEGFPASNWSSAWGQLSTASWGMSFPQPVADPGASLGPALMVPYAAHSSAPSCTTCPDPRGVQWYTDLSKIGLSSLQGASKLGLAYKVKFPSNFAWGGTHFGGKLPGLYGGAPGSATGGTHTGGWTTRYMWRAAGAGEVYLEGPAGVTFGIDLGSGSWHFTPDGQWHSIAQVVDRTAQTVTVWYDGVQVLQSLLAGMSPAPFSGIFFSTFYGGHTSDWGPPIPTQSYFADFVLLSEP